MKHKRNIIFICSIVLFTSTLFIRLFFNSSTYEKTHQIATSSTNIPQQRLQLRSIEITEDTSFNAINSTEITESEGESNTIIQYDQESSSTPLEQLDEQTVVLLAFEYMEIDDESDLQVYCNLETHQGRPIYDVEWSLDNQEFDVQIDALSGSLLAYDYDAENILINSTTSSVITEMRALEISLTHAGFNDTQVQNVQITLESKNGIKEYSIQWQHGNTEYKYIIHATNEGILDFQVSEN